MFKRNKYKGRLTVNPPIYRRLRINFLQNLYNCDRKTYKIKIGNNEYTARNNKPNINITFKSNKSRKYC